MSKYFLGWIITMSIFLKAGIGCGRNLKSTMRTETCIFLAGIMSAKDLKVESRNMSEYFWGGNCERYRFTSTKRAKTYRSIFGARIVNHLDLQVPGDQKYVGIFLVLE